MRKQIMTIGFDSLTMPEAIDVAMDHINTGKKCRVVTPNAEHGLMCKKDLRLLEIINASQLVLPDGISVIYASKILGDPVKEKVAGVEFAENLCSAMQNTGKSLYLFGAKPGVAEQAAEKLVKKYPGLKIAGTHDGYYKDESQVIETINAAQPDAIFICLGAPKQEYFMAKYSDVLVPSLMAGLGGTLDVLAGNVQRAPKIFIKLGLEWLYRLIKEPKRIKRMIRLPIYLMDAVVYRFKGEKKDA